MAKVNMAITAYVIINALAKDLYEDFGQCLMELIRNGLCASMPDPDRKWEPHRAKIEVRLTEVKALAKGKSLVVLDHGKGLTPEGLKRYFAWLGTSLETLRERSRNGSNGSSQKGIGRLAALSLNEKCHDKDLATAAKNGFFVFSRTSPSGNIRFIEVVPERIETEGGTEVDTMISPLSEEARFLNKIEGSFTAIVIPTPVFESAEEIIESIEWLLPREVNKMFDLEVNGKKVMPPELQSTVNYTGKNPRYLARLGVLKKTPGSKEPQGIWLCDAETGFRVASCVREGPKKIPEPLWYPDLSGDIFVPGLLRQQGSARNRLSESFTRKWDDEWRTLQRFLDEVAVAAKDLVNVGEEDDVAAGAIEDIVDLFHGCYGLPPLGGGIGGGGGGGGGGGKPDPIKKPGEPGEPKPRRKSIMIRDEVYHLFMGRSLDEYIFAEVSDDNSNMVFVNVRGAYKALPKNKLQRNEHVLMHILLAIGYNENDNDREPALRFANSVRADLMKTKGGSIK